jgi:hypothetical protein
MKEPEPEETLDHRLRGPDHQGGTARVRVAALAALPGAPHHASLRLVCARREKADIDLALADTESEPIGIQMRRLSDPGQDPRVQREAPRTDAIQQAAHHELAELGPSPVGEGIECHRIEHPAAALAGRPNAQLPHLRSREVQGDRGTRSLLVEPLDARLHQNGEARCELPTQAGETE